MNRKGICYGVSVGPGEEALVTIEALNIIKQADIVFLPSFPKEECMAYQAIVKTYPEIDNKELRCETFTMSRKASVMKDRHLEIAESVKKELNSGKIIAFLTLGEVLLYSTYMYIHKLLVEDGYDSRLITGISSVQAIAARLSLPLAIGREEIHIFPDSEDMDYKLSLKGTKVFMKPKGEWSDFVKIIKDYITTHPKSLAYGISNYGMEGEIAANNVDELILLQGYFTVVIIRDYSEAVYNKTPEEIVTEKTSIIEKNNIENKDSDTDLITEAANENSESFSECIPGYDYYENHSCKYYPCHENMEHINCLFCYCPLYRIDNCPGNNYYIEKDDRRIKVCTNCSFPHRRENYKTIMNILKQQ